MMALGTQESSLSLRMEAKLASLRVMDNRRSVDKKNKPRYVMIDWISTLQMKVNQTPRHELLISRLEALIQLQVVLVLDDRGS